MASVILRKVTKQFGPKVVLEEVSLEVRTGETMGLVGANGAGKTTLFRLVSGNYDPDTGTVTGSRGLEVGLLAQDETPSAPSTARSVGPSTVCWNWRESFSNCRSACRPRGTRTVSGR